MHAVELKIIQLLGRSSDKEWRTTELVQKLFSNDFEQIEQNLDSKDKLKVLEAKRKKAQLHRKILYHINKLVEEDYLFVAKIEGKGEKLFALNKQKKVENKRDEEIRSVFESISDQNKDDALLSNLGSYIDKKIIHVFNEKNWTSKLNAILLRPITNTNELYQRISELHPNYNDVLGIYDFQEVIEHATIDDVLRFLKKIDLDSKDYDKRICLHIDTTKQTNVSKIQSFVESITTLAPENISCVFSITNESLKDQTKLFKEITRLCNEHKVRLHIQNKTIHETPILIGKGGTYTIKRSDWKAYQELDIKRTIGLCFADASIAIDLRKVFEEEKPFEILKELFPKIAKTLILGTAALRKKSDILFSKINELNKPFQHQFFAYATSYIRLWNYDMKADYFDSLTVHLQGAATELETIAKTQETVFRACGLPISVNLSLSSAFRKFAETLSKRRYHKVTIVSKNDILSPEVKKHIEDRQSLLDIMSSDRVRFFRAENGTSKNVVDEFFILLELYKIPLFAYDFKKRQGEVTLDTFF